MEKKLNLLMFSGDYDKALAGLILANSAKNIGADVSIFFAFWGLCIIRDPEKIDLKDKTAYEKMFEMVTPKGVEQLPLSKMNMSGIGKKMLVKMMGDAEKPSLAAFLNGAIKKGVKLYACKLSVEVMGFKENELISEVKIITAEEYLKDAFNSNIQLFI